MLCANHVELWLMTNILTSLLPRKRLQWQDLRTKKGMFLEHGSSICNIMEFTSNMLPAFSLTTVS